MEDARDKGVKLGTGTMTTYVSMLRLNYIRGLDAQGLAEMLDGCTEYCKKYKDGVAYCSETSCVGCIKTWLNEQISVPVMTGHGTLYIGDAKEEKTCEK